MAVSFLCNLHGQVDVIVIGILMFLTAVMTDYEGELIKQVSMAAHLNIDAVAGVLLAVSPWVLGFNQQVYLPHLILVSWKFAPPFVRKSSR